MRKKLFVKNMLIMSFSALVIRGIGMVFAVKAADVMGAGLLGRYRLTMGVYAFFVLAATSGVSITVTRIAGDLIAQKRESCACFVRDRAAAMSSVAGAALGLLMICSSFFLPCELFGSGSANAVRLLAVSLPFAGFSSAVRGYFSARKKNLRNAAEQFIEQLTELIVFIIACERLDGIGFSPLLCAAIATVAAEVISFLYSALLLLSDRRRTPQPKKTEKMFSKAFPIYLPCTASSGLRSALSLAENCLISHGLILYCGAHTEAMEDYGIMCGMALPCVLFPSVFIIPASQLIIPELSAAKTLGQKNGIIHMSGKLLFLVVIYSLIAMLPFIIFPHSIASLLGYPPKAGFFMRVLAPLIPLSFLDSAVDGMLKGLDCQKSYFRINAAEALLRIIMALTLVPLLGTIGAAAVILFGELFNVSLSLWRLIKELKKTAEKSQWAKTINFSP